MNAMTDRHTLSVSGATATPPRPTTAQPSAPIDIYDARDLVKNGVQASLVLDGQVYVLRITRAGKLILTK